MSEAVEPYIQINQLLNEYDFPIEILTDVHQRLSDSDDHGYAMQQVRYLNNAVSAGVAKKRVRDGEIE